MAQHSSTSRESYLSFTASIHSGALHACKNNACYMKCHMRKLRQLSQLMVLCWTIDILYIKSVEYSTKVRTSFSKLEIMRIAIQNSTEKCGVLVDCFPGDWPECMESLISIGPLKINCQEFYLSEHFYSTLHFLPVIPTDSLEIERLRFKRGLKALWWYK